MSSPKVVVITGANNGIGYEAVKSLLQSDKAYHIYLGSRSLEKGRAALEKVRAEVPKTTSTLELLPVDLTSDQSIENAFEQVKTGSDRVDILINNAGKSDTFFLFFQFFFTAYALRGSTYRNID